jgi:low affinity Fe/Cu permease
MKIFSKINAWSDRFAEALADSLASMIMFWIITLLVIVPLFWTQPVGTVAWMQYIVAVFFQGVALPVLGYTAKLSGKRTDALIAKIEELSLKIEQQAQQIEDQTVTIEKDVEEIVDDLKQKIN